MSRRKFVSQYPPGPIPRYQVQGTGAYFWVEDIEAPPYPPREPGRMCRSQLYKTIYEAVAVRNWLHERSLGYPKLDLPRPDDRSAFSDLEGATWERRK